MLTPEEIAACDGIIIAADKNVETARFDGKPVLFARVDDGHPQAGGADQETCPR